MKKKLCAIFLSITISFSITACSNSETADIDTSDHAHAAETDDQFTVELTLPAEYVQDATQEDLDHAALDYGYKSITLNEDGSATYIMTEAQHEEMLADMYNTLNETLTGMIGSAEYPSFSSVTANEDFTKFMVTTISTEYSSEEELATMALYMVSGIYHIFKGEEAENVRIDFVNLDSNETIYSCDSSAMAKK